MKTGLFRKFILMLIFSGLIFGVPTAYLIYSRISDILVKNATNNQEVFAGSLMTNIEHFLYERKIDIQLIAMEESYILNRITPATAKEDYEKMLLLSRKSGPWDLMEIVGSDGRILTSSAKENINKKVDETSPHGQVFQRALLGEAGSSNFFKSGEARASIGYMAPIFERADSGGKVIGVVHGHLSLPALGDLIRQVNSSRWLRLFDSEGLLLASNRPEDADLLYEIQSVPEKISAILNDARLINSARLDEDGTGFTGLVTVAHSAGYYSLEDKNLGLIIDTPLEVILNPARQLALFFVSVIITGLFFQFVFLTSSVFILFFSKVKSMIDTVNQISGGDLRRRVPENTSDELGILGGAFNKMTAELFKKALAEEKKSSELKELNIRLDEKVREKTRNLTEKISELESLKISLINLVEELGVKDAALEQEKSRYQVLLGNIVDGVVAVDTDGRITYVNDELAKLTGMGKDKLIGEKYFEMWGLQAHDDAADLPEVRRPLNLALAGEKMGSVKKYNLIRKDGRKIPIAVSAGPIMVGDEILGAIAIVRDVTQEIEIDRAKNEFISVASHQLRTPLSSMKWLIEALMGSKNIKESDEAKLKNLYISTERLIALVNDLLSISRMESGKFFGEPQTFNILGLLESAAKDYENEAAKTGKKIVLLLPKTAHEIYGNPMLVSEAFKNLLANAIIYGGNDSAITVELKDTDGIYEVSVNNTGNPIPKEDLDRMFTKFFRTPSAMLIKPEGSGLGLYISKLGIEKNGGKIWVESDEKSGTTFHFTVPIIVR